MGHAQAALPKNSAWERKGRSGANHSVRGTSIPAGLFRAFKHTTIHITAPVFANGRKATSPWVGACCSTPREN